MNYIIITSGLLIEFFMFTIYPGIKRVKKGQCFFKGYNNIKEIFNKKCRKKAKFIKKNIKRQINIYNKTEDIDLRIMYLNNITNIHYEEFAKCFVSEKEIDYLLSKTNQFYYIEKILINIKDTLLDNNNIIITSDEVKLKILKSITASYWEKKDILKTVKNKDLIVDYIISTDFDIWLKDIIEVIDLSDKQIIEIINKKDIVEIKTIADIITLIKDDNKKMKLLDQYDFTEYSKEKILCTIKDSQLIVSYLINSDIFTSLVAIIKKIKCNDDLIIQILDNKKHLNNNIVENLIKLLKDDTKKLKYFNNNKEYNTNILASFTNVELRNEIAKEYGIEISNIIYVMITECDDNEKLGQLIYQLNNKSFIKIFESNKEDNINDILNQIKINLNHNIDPDITFGLELEASHKNYMGYRSLKKILGNWTIKPDSSIDNSTEIISPILHFNENDIKQIKYICDFMEKNKFETNEKCGGHIHIGMDYFNTPEDIKMLYYLFCNCESIFYLILNRENSVPRQKINTYAQNISNIISNNKDKLDNCLTTDELIKQLKIAQNFNRYMDINILNAGKTEKNTIEFRLANGEINYYEVMYNVILLTTLAKKAKELSNINNTDSRYNKLMQLSDNIDENIKTHILLDLLFEKEMDKEVYLKRYNTNRRLLKRIIHPTLQKMNFDSIKFNKALKK